jgi:signal transduction histidine kinase
MAQELDYAGGMDFKGLAAAAQAHVDAVDTGAPAQVAPDPVPVSVDTQQLESKDVDLPEAQVQDEQALQDLSTGKVLDVPEDTLVRVKIDGEVKEVPYKEFKDSLQREAAWHKRQQAFADGKRQLEQYYAQQFAELERGAQALKVYEQQLAAQVQQPQAPVQGRQQTPDEIATLSEVRQEAERVGQTIEQKLAARDQLLNQQLANVAQQLKNEMVVKQNALKFEQGLTGILGNKQFKALEAIPNLEQNLRYQVWQLQPETIEEAVQFAERIAKDWNTKLRSIHVAEQQQADAKKAKAKLEPSDGSPVSPQKTAVQKSYLTKDGKLDHTALRAAALALLD